MPEYPPPAATSYTIQASKIESFGSVLFSVTTTQMSYTRTSNLPAGTTIWWRVRANGSNGPSDWTTTFFKTASPPSATSLLSPANGSLVRDYSPMLYWKQVSIPDGTEFASYWLELATDSAFTNIARSKTFEDVAMNTWNVDPLLSSNTKYYWRVQACNTDNECSTWSYPRNFIAALPAPINLSVDGILQNLRPIFSWDMPAYPMPPAASSYSLQVTKTESFSSLLFSVKTTKMSYKSSSDLPSDRILFWRVRANGIYGPSYWTIASFVIGNPTTTPGLSVPANNAHIPIHTPLLD
jgi:hypothetical protein